MSKGKGFDCDGFDLAMWLLVVLLGMLAAALCTSPSSGVEDITPPAIGSSSWSFSPTTATTSSGPVTVTFAVTVTDAATGFSRGTIHLRSPANSGQNKFIGFDAGQRTSGTAQSGVYSIPYSLPQYGDEGTWTVGSVELIDGVGNSKVYPAGDAAFGAYTTLTANLCDALPPL